MLTKLCFLLLTNLIANFILVQPQTILLSRHEFRYTVQLEVYRPPQVVLYSMIWNYEAIKLILNCKIVSRFLLPVSNTMTFKGSDSRV